MFDECRIRLGKSDAVSQGGELETCAGCQGNIVDKYLLRIRSLAWHEQCVTCSACNCQLSEGCFVRDNQLYCAHDYAKRHGTRCQSCGQPIATQDLAIWVQPYAYHLACFVCATCGAQLRKGDQFALRPGDAKPVCLCDADSVVAAAEADADYGERRQQQQQQQRRRSSTSGCGGERRRQRQPRVRTVLTAVQRRQFRAAFDQNPKPSRRTREALAAAAGLSDRVVQVWFQNQRAKCKKLVVGGRRDGATTGSAALASTEEDDGEEDDEDDGEGYDEELVDGEGAAEEEEEEEAESSSLAAADVQASVDGDDDYNDVDNAEAAASSGPAVPLLAAAAGGSPR